MHSPDGANGSGVLAVAGLAVQMTATTGSASYCAIHLRHNNFEKMLNLLDLNGTDGRKILRCPDDESRQEEAELRGEKKRCEKEKGEKREEG